MKGQKKKDKLVSEENCVPATKRVLRERTSGVVKKPRPKLKEPVILPVAEMIETPTEGLWRSRSKYVREEYCVTMKTSSVGEGMEAVEAAGINLLEEALGTRYDEEAYNLIGNIMLGRKIIFCFLTKYEAERVAGHKDVEKVKFVGLYTIF